MNRWTRNTDLAILAHDGELLLCFVHFEFLYFALDSFPGALWAVPEKSGLDGGHIKDDMMVCLLWWVQRVQVEVVVDLHPEVYGNTTLKQHKFVQFSQPTQLESTKFVSSLFQPVLGPVAMLN